MSEYISDEIHDIVSYRADFLCEYCLIHEDDSYFGFQVDHIISLKHGGQTIENNLAYTCIFCNRYKGSDIGSINWKTKEFIRFYNPRNDKWYDHFNLNGVIIESKTEIGEVTIRILRFNDNDRILERQNLFDVGRYPTDDALIRINK